MRVYGYSCIEVEESALVRMTAVGSALCLGLLAGVMQAQQSGLDGATRELARDVFKQLIEINSTDSVGSVTAAAEAMRKRLLDAGFAESDVVVLGPNDRKGNMVARYRGKAGSTKKPVLIIGHIDVVEAKREDWTTDPFVFTEKDGYFYGRGTQDMKDSAAALVVSFMRLKREGFVPDQRHYFGADSGRRRWCFERCELAAEESSRADRCGVCAESGWWRVEYGEGQAGKPGCGGYREAVCGLSADGDESRGTQLAAY